MEMDSSNLMQQESTIRDNHNTVFANENISIKTGQDNANLITHESQTHEIVRTNKEKSNTQLCRDLAEGKLPDSLKDRSILCAGNDVNIDFEDSQRQADSILQTLISSLQNSKDEGEASTQQCEKETLQNIEMEKRTKNNEELCPLTLNSDGNNQSTGNSDQTKCLNDHGEKKNKGDSTLELATLELDDKNFQSSKSNEPILNQTSPFTLNIHSNPEKVNDLSVYVYDAKINDQNPETLKSDYQEDSSEQKIIICTNYQCREMNEQILKPVSPDVKNCDITTSISISDVCFEKASQNGENEQCIQDKNSPKESFTNYSDTHIDTNLQMGIKNIDGDIESYPQVSIIPYDEVKFNPLFNDPVLGADPNFASNANLMEGNVHGLIHLDEDCNLPRELQEFVFNGSLPSENISLSDVMSASDTLPTMDNLSMLVNTYLADGENGTMWTSGNDNSTTQTYYTQDTQKPQQPNSQMYMYMPLNAPTTDIHENQTYFINPSQIGTQGVQLFINEQGQYMTQQGNPFPTVNNIQTNLSNPPTLSDNTPPPGWSSTSLYRYFKPRSVKRDSLTAFRRWRIQQQKRQNEEALTQYPTNTGGATGKSLKTSTSSIANRQVKNVRPANTELCNTNNNCLPKEDEVKPVKKATLEEDEEVDKVYVVPAHWLTESAEVTFHDSGKDPGEVIPPGIPYLTVKNQTTSSKPGSHKTESNRSQICNEASDTQSTGVESVTSNENTGDQDDCPSVEAMIEFCKRYNRCNLPDERTRKPKKKTKTASRPISRVSNQSSSETHISRINNLHGDNNAPFYGEPTTLSADSADFIEISPNHTSVTGTPYPFKPNNFLTTKEIPEGFRLLKVAEHKTADGKTSYTLLEQNDIADEKNVSEINDVYYNTCDTSTDNTIPFEMQIPKDRCDNSSNPVAAICTQNIFNNFDCSPQFAQLTQTQTSDRQQILTPVKQGLSPKTSPVLEATCVRNALTSASEAYHNSPNRLDHNIGHLLTPIAKERPRDGFSGVKKYVSEDAEIIRKIESNRKRHSVSDLDHHPLIMSPTAHYNSTKSEVGMPDSKVKGLSRSIEKDTVMINAYTIASGESSYKNRRTTRTLQPDLIKGWYALRDGTGESNHIVLLEENDNLIVLPIEDDEIKKELGTLRNEKSTSNNIDLDNKEMNNLDEESIDTSARDSIRSRLRSSKVTTTCNTNQTKHAVQRNTNTIKALSKQGKGGPKPLPKHKEEHIESCSSPLTVSSVNSDVSIVQPDTSHLKVQYSDISICSSQSRKSPPSNCISKSHSNDTKSYSTCDYRSVGSDSNPTLLGVSASKRKLLRSKTKANKKLNFDEQEYPNREQAEDISPGDLIRILDPLLRISAEKECQKQLILLQVHILKAKDLLLDESHQRKMNTVGWSLYQCISHLTNAILSSVNSLHCLMSNSGSPTNALCHHLHQMLKVNGEQLCQMIPQYVLVLSTPEEAPLIQEFFKNSCLVSPPLSSKNKRAEDLFRGISPSSSKSIKNIESETPESSKPNIKLHEIHDELFNLVENDNVLGDIECHKPTTEASNDDLNSFDTDASLTKNSSLPLTLQLPDDVRANQNDPSPANPERKASSPRLSTVGDDYLDTSCRTRDSSSDELELCGEVQPEFSSSYSSGKSQQCYESDNVKSQRRPLVVINHTTSNPTEQRSMSSIDEEIHDPAPALDFASFHSLQSDEDDSQKLRSVHSLGSGSSDTVPYKRSSDLNKTHPDMSHVLLENSPISESKDIQQIVSYHILQSDSSTSIKTSESDSSIKEELCDSSFTHLSCSNDSMRSVESSIGARRTSSRLKRQEESRGNTQISPGDVNHANILQVKGGPVKEENGKGTGRSDAKQTSKRRRKEVDENSPESVINSKIKRTGSKKIPKRKSTKKRQKLRRQPQRKWFPDLSSMTKNTSILAGASDSLLSLVGSSSEEVIPQSVKRGFQYKEECLTILNILYNHKESDYFCHEIKSCQDPNYYKIIKRGMCLDVIATKLRQSLYNNMEEYIRDMKLIFTNCRTYHKKGHPLRQSADLLESLFEEKFRSQFPGENLQNLLR